MHSVSRHYSIGCNVRTYPKKKKYLPIDFPSLLCCQVQQMGSARDHVDWLESEIHHAMNLNS